LDGCGTLFLNEEGNKLEVFQNMLNGSLSTQHGVPLGYIWRILSLDIGGSCKYIE
jgi:hypothetical protein